MTDFIEQGSHLTIPPAWWGHPRGNSARLSDGKIGKLLMFRVQKNFVLL